jgi:hypothetical protein
MKELSRQQWEAATRIRDGIVRDAHYMADLTGQFLRSQGYGSARENPAAPVLEEPPCGSAADFLLNVAAALRIGVWERAGLRDALPDPLPPSGEALAAAASHFLECASKPKSTETLGLSMQVFQVTQQHFARSGRQDLETDVLLSVEGLGEDELLERLADFLWEHRHLNNQGES